MLLSPNLSKQGVVRFVAQAQNRANELGILAPSTSMLLSPQLCLPVFIVLHTLVCKPLCGLDITVMMK